MVGGTPFWTSDLGYSPSGHQPGAPHIWTSHLFKLVHLRPFPQLLLTSSCGHRNTYGWEAGGSILQECCLFYCKCAVERKLMSHTVSALILPPMEQSLISSLDLVSSLKVLSETHKLYPRKIPLVVFSEFCYPLINIWSLCKRKSWYSNV